MELIRDMIRNVCFCLGLWFIMNTIGMELDIKYCIGLILVFIACDM